MARYQAIFLCMVLFCSAKHSGKQQVLLHLQCREEIIRTGPGGSWTACAGPQNPQNCAFYQIFDVVITAAGNSDDVTGCDFVFKPTNGVITDSWGYDTYSKAITFYNPLEAGNTHSLAGFIVRAYHANQPIVLTKTDNSPCECNDY